MNYFLYQLQFNTAVHFGASDSALSLHHSQMHFRADTLFSALCHTVLQLDGEAGLNRLVQLASGGALLLSDSMPWEEDRFYLPKPIYAPQAVAEIPGEKRKALKKLVWIPVEAFPDFCAALRTGAFVDIPATAFGTEVDAVKAAVPETEDTLPYPVGLYRFFDGRGLYFLLGCEDQGASDASIRDAVPNDIASLLAKAPIEAVFCNGATAYKIYTKYLEPVSGIPAVRLPSTSPANAACRPEKLQAVWGGALAPWINK